MKDLFERLYSQWGWTPHWQHLFSWGAALVSIFVMAVIVGWIIRGVVGTAIRRIAAKTETQWDDYLFDHEFFRRLGFVLPSIVAYFLLLALENPGGTVYELVRKLILLTVVLTSTGFANRFVNNAQAGFLAIHGEKRIPIRSYVQVAKILLFLVSGILLFSILLDQNPAAILAGLGALTAVLLLVFKDSLLGFMASLQVNTNNLVQIGDWIEFPGQGIDGEVIDIALSVVKIQSADNTVYSMPTYNLVSLPFKNWRNVALVGARRLKLSFPVDILTLCDVSAAQKTELMAKNYWKVPEALANEAVTNAEAFRFWAQSWIEGHGDIHPTLPRVVKLGDPSGRGLPVEMIFHSKITAYPDWEHLHSRMLCTFLAALPAFGLKVFQEPVGRFGV